LSAVIQLIPNRSNRRSVVQWYFLWYSLARVFVLCKFFRLVYFLQFMSGAHTLWSSPG